MTTSETKCEGTPIYVVAKPLMLPLPINQSSLLPRVLTFQEERLVSLQMKKQQRQVYLTPFLEAYKEAMQMIDFDNQTGLLQLLVRGKRKYNSGLIVGNNTNNE